LAMLLRQTFPQCRHWIDGGAEMIGVQQIHAAHGNPISLRTMDFASLSATRIRCST
jgi:hypothetical protein